MKFHFQKIALLSFAAMLAFSSCKKDGDDGDNNNNGCGNPADDFQFMATGHQLTYAYNEFFFGNVGDFTFHFEEQDADGNIEIRLSGNPKPYALNGTDVMYFRACGGKFAADVDPVDDLEDNFQYKANAQVGDKWTHKFPGGKATHEVVETGLTVNTLAGSFPNCSKITYHQAGTINTDTVYWSDKIGWVKYDGLGIAYELKSKNF